MKTECARERNLNKKDINEETTSKGKNTCWETQ